MSVARIRTAIDGSPCTSAVAAAAGAQEGRTGAVATELALTVPVLILLALACADFGRISHYDQIVSNAARTAAEVGATHGFTAYSQGAWEAEVREALLKEMQNIPNFDDDELDYELSTTTDADGLARIVVDVSYPFRTVVAWPAIPTEVRLIQRFETRQFR